MFKNNRNKGCRSKELTHDLSPLTIYNLILLHVSMTLNPVHHKNNEFKGKRVHLPTEEIDKYTGWDTTISICVLL